MIILLSGKQGSGKTTLAKNLQAKLSDMGENVFRSRFAEPLYLMHDAVRDILKSYDINDYDYSKKDGPLLQYLGTEWGRQRIRDSVWVDCLRNRYMSEKIIVESMPGEPDRLFFIVEDCRFKNEFEAFPDGLRVRLECREEIRRQRCEMWRDNTQHPSETDLDDWTDRFDLVVNSEKLSEGEILDIVMERLWKPKNT